MPAILLNYEYVFMYMHSRCVSSTFATIFFSFLFLPKEDFLFLFFSILLSFFFFCDERDTFQDVEKYNFFPSSAGFEILLSKEELDFNREKN